MQNHAFGKLGFSVSRLGFGMMRLPTFTLDDGNSVIDRDEAIRMLRYAIDHGVSYVDTAYGYHHGESEIVTGLALKGAYRDKVKLTSKLPQWLVKENADMDKLLDEQLRKLDVPYLDFYLVHALDAKAFERMQGLQYREFLNRAKRDGRIKHAGFSFHDEKAVFKRIVDDYSWDLAQIHINYLDDQYQATIDGMYYAAERGIPVVAMEPLRGGALSNPPSNVQEKIKANLRGYSPVEWAFRYLADLPEIVTILSGMSTMEQVKDNLRIFENLSPHNLSAADHAFIAELKSAFLSRIKIGCTDCHYCQPCPQGVRIPDLFTAYDQSALFDNFPAFVKRYADLKNQQATGDFCTACGRCEAACPQHLPIIQWLQALKHESSL